MYESLLLNSLSRYLTGSPIGGMIKVSLYLRDFIIEYSYVSTL
ncbi:hypothetical protein EBGED10_27440 [Bacillus sp. GeD10]|nr:hypothetical protein EBGED10_27440 [Bacillus sp. GeD10]